MNRKLNSQSGFDEKLFKAFELRIEIQTKDLHGLQTKPINHKALSILLQLKESYPFCQRLVRGTRNIHMMANANICTLLSFSFQLKVPIWSVPLAVVSLFV